MIFLSDPTYEFLSDSIAKSFSDSTLKSLNERVLFPLRIKYLTQILIPYLKDSGTVLDLGSSDGKLASSIQKHLNVQIIGCDTYIQPKTFIPVVQYDGQHLPFKDNSFDVVTIVDVFHHAANPQQLMQEAKRVSNRYVLVKDHYWDSRSDFTSLKFADYIGNKPYGIDLPYNFMTEENWHDIIASCGLTAIASRKFRFNFIDPCKHILFKLKVRS